MSDDLSIPNPGYRGTRAGRYGTGRSRVRAGLDPDTRRLAIFAGGLGVVLAALIGGSALLGHRSTEVPVVAADSRPIRVKPDNPGGMKIDGAENDVFAAGSDIADSKLAPPPENPDAKALRTASAPPPVVAAPAPAVAPELPPSAIPPATAATAASLPASKSEPLPAAKSAPLPATKPVPIAGAPAAKLAAAVVGKPQIATVEAHSPAARHPVMVQLAAVTSEQAARNEWQLLSKRLGDLLNDKQPDFSRTERDGHTFWRIRTSGFADEAQARSFCDHVRAKGGGCSVADF